MTFVSNKKKNQDMVIDSSFVSELFCNPLDFLNELLLASIGSVERNYSECENMATNHNFKDKTKLYSTLPIENA